MEVLFPRHPAFSLTFFLLCGHYVPVHILPAPRNLTERFDLLIRRLCDAVAIQSAKWAYITPLMVLVWGRLRRMSRRFASLVARMEAGRLKPPRPPAPNPDPGKTRPPRPPPSWPPVPSSPGWLLHYVQLEAAATANLLRHMIEHDPEMRGLLEAAPQLGRILRPLLRMVSPAPLPARLVPPPRPKPTPVAANVATPSANTPDPPSPSAPGLSPSGAPRPTLAPKPA
jgi:hypothetical protein